MISVLGIDPSLKSTGFCLLENDKGNLKVAHIGNFETTRDNKSRTARIADICFQVRLLFGHAPMILALEGYSYNSDTSSLTDLAELSGCIKNTAFTSGMRLLTYPPLTVKSLCMGTELNGLKKTTIADRKIYLDLIRAKYPIFTYDGMVPDIGDAFLIAYTGMMELELKMKPALEFIQAVRSDKSKKMASLKKLMMNRLVDNGILSWSKKKKAFMYKKTEIKSLDQWTRFPTFCDFIHHFRIE